MKKTLLALLASVSLLVGGLFVAAPAQAAGSSVQNWSLSTCTVQYKDTSGTIRSIAPTFFSVYPVSQVRVPTGCTGGIATSPNVPQYVLTPGVWKSFTSMFPSGSHAIIFAYKK